MKLSKKIALLPLVLLFLNGCSGVTTDANFEKILTTIGSNIDPIRYLLFGFAFLTGIAFIFSAIVKFKAIGMGHHQQPQSNITGALVQLLIGVLFLSLPTFINVSLYTIWGGKSIFTGFGETTQLSWLTYDVVFRVVELFGYFAVIRGLFILNKSSHPGGQHETFGKGMVHLIGGILCINVGNTIQLLRNTFGL